MLALEGIKVLDLSLLGPGPFCTMILGDLGAEVVRIEAPPEAGARRFGQESSPMDHEGKKEAAYDALNRNKKSIGINLKSEEGRHIFYRLTETSDVIVEGFRPGVVKRLGIDYETIKKINPSIVYCSITGYGQDGPYRDLPGHDINYISMGGALSLIGEGNGRPTIPLNLLGDYGGGSLYAIIGILVALIVRERTGQGQYIDISMTDGVISLLAASPVTRRYFSNGFIPKRGDTQLSGAFPYYSVYETRDGKFISIGCAEPWFWENLCHELGKEDFIPYHFAPEHLFQGAKGGKWEEIFSYLRQVFLTRTRDEWFELLRQKNIAVGKVYTLDEVFCDPHVLHRGMVVEVNHPTEGKVKQVGIAIKLSDTPGKVRSFSPLFGEHTEEVLLDLGYNKEEIEKLRQARIIK